MVDPQPIRPRYVSRRAACKYIAMRWSDVYRLPTVTIRGRKMIDLDNVADQPPPPVPTRRKFKSNWQH